MNRQRRFVAAHAARIAETVETWVVELQRLAAERTVVPRGVHEFEPHPVRVLSLGVRR